MNRPQFPLPSKANPLSNPTLQYFELTPTKLQADANNGATPAPSLGQPYAAAYDIRGDWLYVAPDSCMPVRGDIISATGSDIAGVMLVPGLLIQFPFNRLRVFGTYNATPAASLVVTAASPGNPPEADPKLRIYFGVGPCPFAQPAESRGGFILGAQSVVNAAGIANARYRAEAGTLLDVFVNVLHVTGAAETSQMGVMLGFEDPGAGGVLYGAATPDQLFVVPVIPAAVGTGRLIAAFRNVVVPRGCNAMLVQVNEYGSAITNTINGAPLTVNGGFTCVAR